MIDCYENGCFFYYPLYEEVVGLKEQAEKYDDSELIEEIHELCYDNNDPIISDILHNYWMGYPLEEHERLKLEWFYVTAWTEGGLIEV